jgi:hypothetical protein
MDEFYMIWGFHGLPAFRENPRFDGKSEGIDRGPTFEVPNFGTLRLSPGPSRHGHRGLVQGLTG